MQRSEKIKISVITVCRNAENIISETIESVIKQTYDNIEYLIVDGNSTDKTLKYIKEYSLKNNITYISENDNGIYDAMNKGICMATGDFLCFLNAGDCFYNNQVIDNIVEFIMHHPADIYYGDIIYKYPNGDKVIRTYGNICGTKLYYCTGDSINHQSIFASKKCFERSLFDTSYKICADREWMMRMHKKRFKYKAIHQLIAEYSLDEGSASIANKNLYKAEADRCMREQFKMLYPLFWGIEAIRNSKRLSKILHKVYEILFIRKND